MARTQSVATPDGPVTVVFTDRADGDFAIDGPQAELDARRRAIVDRPWTWLRQVHGGEVVTVAAPGDAAGTEADGAVTTMPGCPLAVMTADCAPVVLVADRGVAVAHAGWRGILAGVIDAAAAQLEAAGARPVATLLGPCINPEAYEFGAVELDLAAANLGESVRSRTSWGTPALDVPEAVVVACRRAGWPPPPRPVPCTSGAGYFSHRTRGEPDRQAAVVWIADGEGS